MMLLIAGKNWPARLPACLPPPAYIEHNGPQPHLQVLVMFTAVVSLLPTCLPAYLPSFLPAFLPACLPACLPPRLPARLPARPLTPAPVVPTCSASSHCPPFSMAEMRLQQVTTSHSMPDWHMWLNTSIARLQL